MKSVIMDKLLTNVQKPSRYTGNEYNMVIKDLNNIDIRFAFAFPDVYEIGMSHLGMRIIYHMINERNDTYCERVFAPWTDMEKAIRLNEIPLFTLETKDFIKDFDIVGFTLQYEMSYSNILNMLDLANIPICSKDRDDNHPLIIAGGPCAYNPEPLSQIIDIFVIGEGEEVIHEVLDIYKGYKNNNKMGRTELLERCSSIQGVYVPSFYNVDYNENNTLKRIYPINQTIEFPIKKRLIKDLDNAFYPEKVIVPYTDIVHDRVVLEIFRGCTRGCRFCQAGMIYRPVRERSIYKLMELAETLLRGSGYEEISLASLSSTDYSQLEKLVVDLMKKFEEDKISVSLPSMRLDSFSKDFIEQIKKVRKTGLTFAPEAGTQRLRDVINKGIGEEDLIKSVKEAFKLGWTTVKLYFMLGLPTETDDDVKGIVELSLKVLDCYKQINGAGKKLKLTVSTSTFVPKPFTPYQWQPQFTMEDIKRKQELLRSAFDKQRINYNWHAPELSFLEAVFSRGDRRLNGVLIEAWKRGCKFDSWNDYFDYNKWMGVFEDLGIDPYFYATRTRYLDELLPWEHIDIGITKSFLKKELEKSKDSETTPDCREKCSNCGIKSFQKGLC